MGLLPEPWDANVTERRGLCSFLTPVFLRGTWDTESRTTEERMISQAGGLELSDCAEDLLMQERMEIPAPLGSTCAPRSSQVESYLAALPSGRLSHSPLPPGPFLLLQVLGIVILDQP